MAEFVKENILILCGELKPEAVTIADALAPPDFVLNSVLGMSDGKVFFTSVLINILFEFTKNITIEICL